jgi:hypothetical protein
VHPWWQCSGRPGAGHQPPVLLACVTILLPFIGAPDKPCGFYFITKTKQTLCITVRVLFVFVKNAAFLSSLLHPQGLSGAPPCLKKARNLPNIAYPGISVVSCYLNQRTLLFRPA